MSKQSDSADLIMKLYDLRRDATMCEARTWYVGSFFPDSADDVLTAMIAPATSAFFRMVVSYWDMAASFVNRGAIDEEMFLDSGGECIIVFAKIEPFIDDLRAKTANPKMLANLQSLIMRMPNAGDLLASRREMIKRMVAARAEMANGA